MTERRIRRVYQVPGVDLRVMLKAQGEADKANERRVNALSAAGDYLRGNYTAVENLLNRDPMASDTLRMDTAPQLQVLAERLLDTGVSPAEITTAAQAELVEHARGSDVRHLSAVSRAYGSFLGDIMGAVQSKRDQAAKATKPPQRS